MPVTTFAVHGDISAHEGSISQAQAVACPTQQQYEELVGSLEAIVWRTKAATGEHIYVNEQAEHVLGYPIGDWLRWPHFKETHVHPDDRMKVLALYRRAAQEPAHHRLDYRMTAADGRELWFHECVHSVIEEHEGGEELIGVMMDITDRKSTERSLIEMTGRLIRAQEEERCRIARELHDDFNQRLALLSIGLERLGQRLAPEGAAASELTDLYGLTQGIASDVHRLSHQLHSSKLEHLGLVPAIKGLCREFSEQHGAQLNFVHRNIPPAITKDSALCLFRVVQEAVSNTMKHSGVRKGRVELFGDRGTLHLSISDAGAGFDPQSVSAKGHLGLVSMQERVRAAGGTIVVESRPARGTRISVRLAV